MNSKPINHQFEFWSHLGTMGAYIYLFDGYTALTPKQGAWSRKIFNLKDVDLSYLKCEIEDQNLPRSIAIDSQEALNLHFEVNGFARTSVVEGMTLRLSSKMTFEEHPNIIKVTHSTEIDHFAKIASNAFGYDIHPTSLIGLLEDKQTQLFLGFYQDQWVSCGILFVDGNGDSGLHMIGAAKEFRGLGLGKEMTQHLLFHAVRKGSQYVHLVASKLGVPIYEKLGFVNQGFLNSYSF